jgi:hypothetical protein
MSQPEDHQLRKKSPFIVNVNKYETESFMQDIIKGAAEIQSKQKLNKKALFLKSFLTGFTLFSFILIVGTLCYLILK